MPCRRQAHALQEAGNAGNDAQVDLGQALQEAGYGADDADATMPAMEHVDAASVISSQPRRRWRAPNDDESASTSTTHDSSVSDSPLYMHLRQNPVPNSRYADYILD
jgi:hypothetical protein